MTMVERMGNGRGNPEVVTVFCTSTHGEVWKIGSCRRLGFHGQYWTFMCLCTQMPLVLWDLGAFFKPTGFRAHGNPIKS